jgi:predicted transcriptional regulator
MEQGIELSASERRLLRQLDLASTVSLDTVEDTMWLRKLRYDLAESQTKFWRRFGVTQSSGSRFEAGTSVPPPVVKLVRLYAMGKISDFDLAD